MLTKSLKLTKVYDVRMSTEERDLMDKLQQLSSRSGSHSPSLAAIQWPAPGHLSQVQ